MREYSIITNSTNAYSDIIMNKTEKISAFTTEFPINVQLLFTKMMLSQLLLKSIYNVDDP